MLHNTSTSVGIFQIKTFQSSDGFGYHFPGSGRVRVPKKLGFRPGFGVQLGFLATSLLMGSCSKSRVRVGFEYYFLGSVRVLKKSGSPAGFGFIG